MNTINGMSTMGAAVFLARMQAETEALDLDSAKADLDASKQAAGAIRDAIKGQEQVLAKKQADLDAHLDRGPGWFQKLTGIGDHDQVTEQKKDSLQITESNLQGEEAKLKKEREEISQALAQAREALQASAGTRRDIVSLLEESKHVTKKMMRG